MRALLRRLLAGWQEIAFRFGEVQTLVILCLFYAILIGPASVIGFLGRQDLLHKRDLGASDSAWNEADTAKPELERVKHQF